MKKTKTKFRVMKCWEISTSHITRNDDILLAEHCACKKDIAQNNCLTDISADVHAFGYFIYPTNKLTEKSSNGLSKDFIKIYNDAIKAGVELIRIDSDATINDDYPVFDW